jgi:hypothetical protein
MKQEGIALRADYGTLWSKRFHYYIIPAQCMREGDIVTRLIAGCQASKLADVAPWSCARRPVHAQKITIEDSMCTILTVLSSKDDRQNNRHMSAGHAAI